MFPAARGLSSFVLMIAPSIGIVHAQTAPAEVGLDLNIELHDALRSDRNDELPVGGRLGHAGLSQRITATHSFLTARAFTIRAHRWHSIRSLNRPPKLTS